MGGNMVRPDLEMVHDEMGRIYYQGKVYHINRMASGWVLSRTDELYTGESVEDCCTWLMAQLTY